MEEQQKVGALLIALIVMLIFTAVMTYAYFTASAKSEDAGQITFGHLELNLNDFSASVECCKNAGVIVPGCKINFNGELEINTNIDCFVRVCFSCLVNGDTDNNFTNIIFKDLEDCMTSSQKWLYYKNDNENIVYYYKRIDINSFTFEYERKLDLCEISLNIDKEKIGNDYQGKEISFKIEAEAIQAAHIYGNGNAPTDLESENVLPTLSQNKAWPSTNKDNSSQGQESGKSESGKDGKADDDSESDNDGKTGDDDKDDVVKIDKINLNYYVKGLEPTNEINFKNDLTSKDTILEIETNYFIFKCEDEFSPFNNLTFTEIDRKFNVIIDLELVNVKIENDKILTLDSLNLEEEKANLKESLGCELLSYGGFAYMDLVDCQTCSVLNCNTDILNDLIKNFKITLSKVDENKEFAIKFKLKIEWAE